MRRRATKVIPFSLACVFLAACVAAPGGEPGKYSPPPYVFNLGGLSARQVEALKKVPGVVKVAPKSGRVRVVWQPFNNDVPWNSKDKWIKNAERIYDFLALKGKIGRTQWTHGGMSSDRAGTIIRKLRGRITFSMKFNDVATGHNEIMKLHGFNQALPGQVEHEMLRDVAGTNVNIEKCGPGYVVVSRAGRGVAVVWQVSDQMFVRIDNSYDKEMVAAYVKRLGSIIPKDYKISVDKWVGNEIRWRIVQFDERLKWRIEHNGPQSVLYGSAPFLTGVFTDLSKLIGTLSPRASLEKEYQYMNFTRYFLWANRKNFKYDDRGRGYVLKGKDLYDPEHPPELPPELRPPPKPKEKPTKPANSQTP